MTDAEIANVIGYEPTYISKVRSGKRNAGPKFTGKLKQFDALRQGAHKPPPSSAKSPVETALRTMIQEEVAAVLPELLLLLASVESFDDPEELKREFASRLLRMRQQPGASETGS